MRQRAFDYATYWSAASAVAGYPALLVGRSCAAPTSWLATFLVCNALVVCVVGTDTVARHLAIPFRGARAVYSAHMRYHVLPLVAALVLLVAWKVVVRERASPVSIATGALASGALFAVWGATPLGDTRATFFDKVSEVYNVNEARLFVAAGASFLGAGCGLAALAGA